MGYRDEHEALRAKSDALETDLADAHERLAELECRGDADQRELRRLRRQLARGIPRRRAPIFVIVMVVLFLLGVIGGMLAFSTNPKPPVAAPSSAEVVAPRYEAPPRVAFGARVLRTEGIELPTACVFVVDLERGPDVRRLVARCGDRVLFDSAVEQPGVRVRDHQLREIEQHELLQYRLRYRDTGTGLQIVLDSQHHRARIWSADFDVRFVVDDRSGLRAGTRFGQPLSQPIADSLHVRAIPTTSRGDAPEIAETCELRVHPAVGRDSQNCRIVVDCGTILYGANNGGYNECTFDGARPDRARDERGADFDGDPRLDLDFRARSLVVYDSGWRHELTLEEDERCRLDGRWRGDFRSMGLYLMTQNGQAMATTDLADSMAWDAQIDVDCKSGHGTITIDELGVLEGRFGPGFEAFVGHARSLDPATFYLMRE